MGKSQKSI